MAIMLMVVVLIFLACNAPAMASNLVESLGGEAVELTQLSNFFVVLNSSVNIFVYFLFGRKFRRVFMETFCCLKARTLHGARHYFEAKPCLKVTFVRPEGKPAPVLPETTVGAKVETGSTETGWVIEREIASSPAACIFSPETKALMAESAAAEAGDADDRRGGETSDLFTFSHTQQLANSLVTVSQICFQRQGRAGNNREQKRFPESACLSPTFGDLEELIDSSNLLLGAQKLSSPLPVLPSTKLLGEHFLGKAPKSRNAR